MYHCATLALQEDIPGQFVSIKGQEEKRSLLSGVGFLQGVPFCFFPKSTNVINNYKMSSVFNKHLRISDLLKYFHGAQGLCPLPFFIFFL